MLLPLFASGDATAPVITITPPGGSYPLGQMVEVATDEPAPIYYTIDGSTPTTGSEVYDGSINVGNATLKCIAVDTAGNSSAVVAAVYTIASIDPVVVPPEDWQEDTASDPPGLSGSWGGSAPPLAPALPSVLPPIYGLTDYQVLLDGVDITGLCNQLTLTDSESNVFATCSFDLPVGVTIRQNAAVVVTIEQQSRHYLAEEVAAEGPKRSIWCRAASCLLDEPHAAEVNYNGWDNPHATAIALATTICGAVPLVWSLPDWSLPPTWELTGTPVECLQSLVQACGGILQSLPSGGIEARRRWTVRPVDMAAQTASLEINRDTVLSLSVKDQAGKGYGTITVYGYDPSSALPDLEVEESSPKLGLPVHVKVFWKTTSRPLFSTFITDGQAAKISDGSVVITDEEVTFDNGSGSTRYPVQQLHYFSWLGNDQGNVWWLANGDSRELAMSNAAGRGIAEVTYTTGYERWQLTGQTAHKVIFGLDLGEGQISATVNYSSGGSLAPAMTAPLLNSSAICIEAGTAFLEQGSAVQLVDAELPMTTAPPLLGCAVAVDDTVSGSVGIGKLTGCTTNLNPGKTTMRLEVQVCR